MERIERIKEDANLIGLESMKLKIIKRIRKDRKGIKKFKEVERIKFVYSMINLKYFFEFIFRYSSAL